MSRGRSAARDRWRGALSRYIMSLPEPVGRHICHVASLTHVRAGPLRPGASARRARRLPDNQILKPGPESMSDALNSPAMPSALETATKQHAGEHLTFSEHPQAEQRSCDVRNAARGPVVVSTEITGTQCPGHTRRTLLQEGRASEAGDGQQLV
jgi:hypothetical protein